MLKNFFITAIFLFITASMSSAGLIADENMTYQLFGKASIEAGEVVSGQNNSPNALDHLWLERTTLHLGLEAIYKEQLKINVVVEGNMLFPHPYYTEAAELHVFYPINGFSVYQAFGTYTFIGDISKPKLEIGAGLFPFKFDPYSTNLGEYPLRSSCYPSLTQNSFDQDSVRVLGLRASSNIGDLKLDLLLTSEINYWPLMDFSLAGFAEYKLFNFIDLGLGINFYRLFPVEASKTTPKIIDNQIPYTGADTSKIEYYTFAGTMVNARLALDLKEIPKALGVSTDIFGHKDLWLYGELAVLGLKDYEYMYDTLSQRMPLMMGFNFPCFKLLDVFSIECEYWDNPHVNSYRGIWSNQLPQWPPEKNDQTDKAKWKWSVYAKKSVLKDHVQLMFQIARDHYFLPVYNNSVTVADAEETLKQYKDYAWWMKIQFNF